MSVKEEENESIEKVVAIKSDNTVDANAATSLKEALQLLVKYAAQLEEAERKKKDEDKDG